MNCIQYMKPGGNFGNKLKTGIEKFLKAAGEASRMAKDVRINNPGAAMIRDAYQRGNEELAKQLTDEMQAANLTGIMIGSGAGPLATGFATAPVTTGVTLATGVAGGVAGAKGVDKAISSISDGQYNGWADWVDQSTNGVIGQNTAGIFHPGAILGGSAGGYIGSKAAPYANGVVNRGLEAALRIGDQFAGQPVTTYTQQLFGNKLAGMRYILGGNKNLAYNMRHRYDGMTVNSETAHKGDIIDVLMGKTNTLLSKEGRVLGELTPDLSNVPQSTIKAFQSLPGHSTTQPKVLKMGYEVEKPFQNYQLDKVIDAASNTPTQAFRSTASRTPVQVPGPYTVHLEINPKHLSAPFRRLYGQPASLIDPGHYGVTAVRSGQDIKLYGHDVYHYTPKLFVNKNGGMGAFKLFNFTVGKPFIAEWGIKPVLDGNDFVRLTQFGQIGDKSMFLNPTKYVPHLDARYDSTPPLLSQQGQIPLQRNGGSIQFNEENKTSLNYLNYSR